MTSKYQIGQSNICQFPVSSAVGASVADDAKDDDEKEANAKDNAEKTTATPVQLARTINPAWTVHRLFGKRHWVSVWVIRLCASEPRFLLHLIDQPPDYVHFVCLVRLALSKHSAADESLKYAAAMLTQNKKTLLGRLYPSAPDGLLGMLAKLPGKPLSQDDYHRLVRLLADAHLRKMPCHKKRVRRFDLRLFEMLEDIPQEFQCSDVMECVKKQGNYESLQLLIHAVRHLNLALNKSEISAATRQLGCMRNLSVWFMEKFTNAPFPPPPWRGNDWIKPVCRQSELAAIGKKFKKLSRA